MCVQNDFLAYGTFDTNRASIVRQDWHYLQMDRNELRLEPRNLGVPSDAYKMISEPMLRLAQTVQLSCVQISTISKRTEMSFHLCLITSGTIRSVQNDF